MDYKWPATEHTQTEEPSKRNVEQANQSDKSVRAKQLVHEDPLQSIANVLNHHRAIQQQQRRKFAPQVSSEQATATSGAEDEEAKGRDSAQGGVAVSVATTATATVSKSASELPSAQSESKLSNKIVSRQTNLTPVANKVTGRGKGEADQVDQGNSYLYAYNDFITAASNRNSDGKRDKLPELTGADGKLEAVATDLNDSKFASEPKQEEQTNFGSSSLTNLKNFRPLVAVTKKLPFVVETSKRRESSSSKRSKSKLLVALRRRASEVQPAEDFKLNKRQQLDTQQAVVAHKSTARVTNQVLNSRILPLDQEEEVDQVEIRNDHRVERQDLVKVLHCLDQGDLLTSNEDGDEDDDADDTLSFILNRHRNLAQQQQATTSIKLKSTKSLICPIHQDPDSSLNFDLNQSTILSDNSNHLRQYLQIEENFNSYKAAKRRHHNYQYHQHNQQQHNSIRVLSQQVTSRKRREIVDELELEGEQAARARSSSDQMRAATNLHLPLANYLIATNEQAPDDQFDLQQLNQRRQLEEYLAYRATAAAAPLEPGATGELPMELNQDYSQPNNSACGSQSQPNPHLQTTTTTTRGRRGSGSKSYLQLFKLVKPKLIGKSQGGKMFSHAKQQHFQAAAHLTGQAGAYCVTTSGAPNQTSACSSASSSSTEANLASDSLIASNQQCSRHSHAHLHQFGPQQQQHQRLLGQPHLHAHHAQRTHLLGHHQPQATHYTNHYPLGAAVGAATSSDSSLGSSGAFANSRSAVVRATSSWLRDFCSKKCLFFTCLMLISFIFILVISLSAYLNFLITSSRTNLLPLSGRLKLDLTLPSDLMTAGQSINGTNAQPLISGNMDQFAQRLFHNKSSFEFLEKQRDFETIIRGAMDRTQTLLKSFPNHLVKLEVYSIKPTTALNSLASLWIYFRLFLNKRTLQLDQQLMKRKSPDEHFDRQFLPRLTQQTLHSGFEQLLQMSNGNNLRLVVSALESTNNTAASESSSTATLFNQQQQLGINSRRFGGSQIDSISGQVANRRLATRATKNNQAAAAVNSAQKQQLKSFDEQISRLMYLIEAIDLQSILVTPEFDMTAASSALNANSQPTAAQSMSATLRASEPISTSNGAIDSTTNMSQQQATPTSIEPNIMTANNSALVELSAKSNATGRQPTVRQVDLLDANLPATTQTETKFTIQQGYKENATRPSLLSSTTSSTTTSTTAKPTLFLINLAQKKQLIAGSPSQSTAPTTTTATSLTTLASTSERPNKQQNGAQVVRLLSGQPLVSQSGQTLTQKLAGGATSGGSTQPPNKPKISVASEPSTTSTTSTTQSVPTLRQIATSSSSTTRQLNSFGQFSSPTSSTPSTTAASIEELWNNVLNNNANLNSSPNLDSATAPSSTPKSLLSFPSTSSSSNASQNSLSNSNTDKLKQTLPSSAFGSNKLESVGNNLSQAASNSNQQQQQQWQKAVTASQTAKPPQPKVAPQMNFAGSLVARNPATNQVQRQRDSNGQVQMRHQHDSAVVLNREFNSTPNQANQQRQQQAISSANSTIQMNAPTRPKQTKKQKQTTPRNNASSSSASISNLNVNHQHQQHSSNRAQQQNGTMTVLKANAKLTKVKKVVNPMTNEMVNLRNQSLVTIQTSAGATSSSIAPPSNTTVNGKGIRIVDNFLASISNGQSQSEIARDSNTTINGANKIKLQPGAKLRDAPNSNAADSTTLPTALTTIELTRSTTTSATTTTTTPVSSTTPMPTFTSNAEVLIVENENENANENGHDNSNNANNNNNNLTADFVVSDQQARPGTTSFSGQWRPIQSSSSSKSDEFPTLLQQAQNSRNRSASTSRGSGGTSLALIVPVDRLPDNLNRATGSQSPFAMPNLMMMPVSVSSQPKPPATQSGFSNRFRAQPSRSLLAPPTPQNDFESRRVSRMRQSQSQSHRSSEMGDPFGTMSSSSSSDSRSLSSSSSSSSSSTTSSTTTSSSLNLMDAGANTRIVDDFMITTDRNDGSNGRSSTLLPPLVLSQLHQPQSSQRIELAPTDNNLPVQSIKRRTRGPFAFETLSSIAFSTLDSPVASQTLSSRSGEQPLSSSDTTFDSLDQFEPTASSNRNERSPRVGEASSQAGVLTQQQVDDKMLLRKQLFATAQHTTIEAPNDGQQNHDKTSASNVDGEREFGDRKRRLISEESSESLINCPHFGCNSAANNNGGQFVCLNETQICDDHVDCQDESDELDCVSLLKFDSNTQKMSFSNGAGIIYLNRRGSLAPMCVDYYHPNPITNQKHSSLASIGDQFDIRISRQQTNSAHELEAIRLEDAMKRQNELIKQINTIGQYACNLQSFSRLASVKINTNDQVDGSNLIKESKLFHRLSISDNDINRDEEMGNVSSLSESSYESGNREQYQVQILSSPDCLSQRTVFVKCGGFECGRNSNDLRDSDEHRTRSNNEAQSKRLPIRLKRARPALDKGADDATTLNNLPWLVKLYWENTFVCHSFLIDESWLIVGRDCNQNRTTSTGSTVDSNNNNELLIGKTTRDGVNEPWHPTNEFKSTGWTAEISNEQIGNVKIGWPQATRRRVKEILSQPTFDLLSMATPIGAGLGNQNDGGGQTNDGSRQTALGDRPFGESPIVLAKLERPVRFSPLNRPICLPNTTDSSSKEPLEQLEDCLTVTLPLNYGFSQKQAINVGGDEASFKSSLLTLAPPTQLQQNPILNKVKLVRVNDCWLDEQASRAIEGNNLLCASEINSNSMDTGTGVQENDSNQSPTNTVNKEHSGATRVLICSPPSTVGLPLSQHKWTLVGVETKTLLEGLQKNNRRLFNRVSSQIDWIVDTMNPKFSADLDRSNLSGQMDLLHSSDLTSGSMNRPTSLSSSSMNNRQISSSSIDGLNPLLSPREQPASITGTCNHFKCSSGECLSWSRICDGLYDCSSHDDEKDCHK